MIFFDYYFRDFSIPKVLAPLAECMKKYQGVLVADQETLDKVVDELKEVFNAIPKAKERFLFNVSEGLLGVISVHRNNPMRKCILYIYYTPVLDMCGFNSSQRTDIQPVPDDGDNYYNLPENIKHSVQKGGAK